MKIIINVIASGEDSARIRRKIDPHEHVVAAQGTTVFIQGADGRLRAAYLQLEELENLPGTPIVNVEIVA